MKRNKHTIFALVMVALAATFASPTRAADASRDVGVAQQELGKAQKEITGKMTEPQGKMKPEKSVEEVMNEAGITNAVPEKAVPEAAPAATAEGEGVPSAGDRVTAVVLDGDGALMEQLGLRRQLEAEVIGRSIDEKTAKAAAGRFQTSLHDAGYYFASVKAEWPMVNGTLTLVVDQGRYGEVRIYQRGVEGRKSYEGRYFSEENIRNRLKSLKQGDAFNYGELYNTVYRINAHPDLLADVDLKPRTEKKGDYSRRVVDMDFAVEDDLPLHGALEFSNNGTDVTDEWEANLTLQYLNVSGVEDVLTLNAPFSMDFESIKSVSLGYFRPIDWRRGGSVAVFGGYSELSSESIVDEIGLEGEGWFAGVQGGYNFIDNEDYTLIGSLGISHSVVSDNLVLQEQDELDREVSLTPVLLSANYVANTPDRWGGLTMASFGVTVHSSSFPGASDDEEFEQQRENAKANYLVGRLDVSRVQGVFEKKDKPDASWTLYTKLDGQVATEPLIPSEQKAIGGYDTVRGYIEREFLGDDGLNGSVELRTPMHYSSVFPKWFKKYNEKNPAFETLQGVLFLDAGYISLKDAIAGEEDSQAIASIGLGCRVALGSNAQLRADWGFPLEETEDSDFSGRGHLSLQLLF